MTEQEKAAKKEGRALVEAEEWKDGPGQKTICEYHKDGLPDGVCDDGEVDDLEYFSEYWKKGGQGKLHSEYHKEGAPYLEESSDWEGHGQAGRPAAGSPKPVDELATGSRQMAVGTRTVEKRDASLSSAVKTAPKAEEAPVQKHEKERAQGDDISEGHMVAVPKIERVVDLSTLEVASYAIFRALFGRGIRVPIKREGIIDMDVVVRDKDIILNTNSLTFEVPELSIWKLVLAYQGKPVLEFGRGVKNRVKVYRWRLAMLLLKMWWHGRRAAEAAH
jgi:hypothetical protein